MRGGGRESLAGQGDGKRKGYGKGEGRENLGGQPPPPMFFPETAPEIHKLLYNTIKPAKFS